MPNDVYIFRAVLNVTKKEGKKKPYRDVAIKNTQTLSTLARAIVTSFGFDFDHCYGFYDNLKDPFAATEVYELFTDLGEEPTPGARGVERIPVKQVFPDTGTTMLFLFDYGDGWRFTVTLSGKKAMATKQRYPVVIKSVGTAPEQYPAYEEEYEYEVGDPDDWEAFDDCAVCQGMKEAQEKEKDLSLEELTDLFDTQNKKKRSN